MADKTRPNKLMQKARSIWGIIWAKEFAVICDGRKSCKMANFEWFGPTGDHVMHLGLEVFATREFIKFQDEKASRVVSEAKDILNRRKP